MTTNAILRMYDDAILQNLMPVMLSSKNDTFEFPINIYLKHAFYEIKWRIEKQNLQKIYENL